MKDVMDAYTKMGTCPFIRDEDDPTKTMPVRNPNNNFHKAASGQLREAGQGTAVYDKTGTPIASDPHEVEESSLDALEFDTFSLPSVTFMLELAPAHHGKTLAAQNHFASIAESSYSLSITSKATDKAKKVRLVVEGDEADLARFGRDLKNLKSLTSVRITK